MREREREGGGLGWMESSGRSGRVNPSRGRKEGGEGWERVGEAGEGEWQGRRGKIG